MTIPTSQLHLGIIAGEASGENLAAGVVDALAARGMDIKLTGVGGPMLAERGLESLFEPGEIALMGIQAVLTRIPSLLRRIAQTADALIAAKPDIILMVDVPDFSHRVARRIKARWPDAVIVKYVAPTVWAWRPKRAAAMRGHFDHVLALFPFEPAVMEELGGPRTTYIGHPLAVDADLSAVWDERRARTDETANDRPLRLVALPGSRKAEIKALGGDFAETIAQIEALGRAVDVTVPTLPHLQERVRAATADWPVAPRIVAGRAAMIEALRDGDVALAASGTVLLDLALAGMPAVSIYRLDPIMRALSGSLLIWSAAMPNVIADEPVVPEYYDRMVRAGMLARSMVMLADRHHLRHKAMMDGYARMRARMTLDESPAERAAAILLDLVGRTA